MKSPEGGRVNSKLILVSSQGKEKIAKGDKEGKEIAKVWYRRKRNSDRPG